MGNNKFGYRVKLPTRPAAFCHDFEEFTGFAFNNAQMEKIF